MITNAPIPGSKTGSYTGDGTANKAIAHGLGKVPSLVIILGDTLSAYAGLITVGQAEVYCVNLTTAYSVTAMTNTNFYVGNATSYLGSMNNNASGYHWVALP